MKTAQRYLFSALALLLMSAVAHAAPLQIVQWRVKSAPSSSLRPGQLFDVVVTGKINPGWHVYALEEPEGGPVATIVGLADGDPADLRKVDQGQPKMVLDPVFQEETGLFEGSVDFTLHVAWNKRLPAGQHVLHVLIRYQSCDDHLCLAPRTDTVSVPLTTQP